MKRAIKHLKKDPVLREAITEDMDEMLKQYWTSEGDYYIDLIEIVIGQQLSVKVAKKIFERFKEVFDGQVDPQKVLNTDDDVLRDVGLSSSKVKYVKNISNFVLNEEKFEKIDEFENGEIHELLTSIKGVGPWTVNMFLIFSLKRSDIFSIGDLGLREAVSRLYGVDREDRKKILEISRKWKPHRTLASRLLWRSLGNP